MKKLILATLVLSSSSVFADVTCTGIPSAVYAGVHGPSPHGSTYWVSIPGVGTLPMGLANDDMAKSRFSLAQTAFVAKKRLILKYYSYTSCDEAKAAIATPTYAAIAE